MRRPRGRSDRGPEPPGARVVIGLEPVREALAAGRSFEALWIARGHDASTREVLALARGKSIRVLDVPKEALERRAGTSKTQGILGLVREGLPDYRSLEEILLAADDLGEEPLVVVLDGVEDPHNLGAIIRSAYALGAHGVVIPKNRAAGLTPAVVKVSAGAAEHLAVVRVTNVKNAISDLRDAGLVATAATLDGAPLPEVKLGGPRVLVLGGEGAGVRPSVAQACDERVTIPMARSFDSLNVSVAAGVMLYAARAARLARSPQID
ncbi:MAG: 23S rRNA (guanosine(2251)-2'-O)-methyltransferase RlmB [Deltaproteobacteria bacterium]|nr:23S rRNA (guanosine(2251)-2'-O)-methyltransferase RlmB [Deltaproteobacteria bacterium]